MGFGLACGGLAFLLEENLRIAAGILALVGLLLGGSYLLSPTWRLRVVTNSGGLEVFSGPKSKFQLSWDEIIQVIASPSTQTCFVNGGDPTQSLLVPGPGAPASYDIENKDKLYGDILRQAPADRVKEVELLETANLSNGT